MAVSSIARKGRPCFWHGSGSEVATAEVVAPLLLDLAEGVLASSLEVDGQQQALRPPLQWTLYVLAFHESDRCCAASPTVLVAARVLGRRPFRAGVGVCRRGSVVSELDSLRRISTF
jgi:hypothetical protein